MDLLTLVVTLIVVGVLLYLIEKFIPMDPAIKKIIQIVVVVVVCIWILQQLGFLGHVGSKNINSIGINK